MNEDKKLFLIFIDINFILSAVEIVAIYEGTKLLVSSVFQQTVIILLLIFIFGKYIIAINVYASGILAEYLIWKERRIF